MSQRLCQVNLVKKADDENGFGRVSLGGPIAHPTDDVDGFYCTYRGNLDQAIVIVQAALIALTAWKASHPHGEEPPIEPEEGKQFA